MRTSATHDQNYILQIPSVLCFDQLKNFYYVIIILINDISLYQKLFPLQLLDRFDERLQFISKSDFSIVLEQ